MKNKKRIASWGTRLAINFFALLLTILFFWFLGFMLKDLRTLPGPDYRTTVASLIDPQLKAESEDLKREIKNLRDSIERKKRQQSLLQQGSNSIDGWVSRLNSVARGENDETKLLQNHV